MVQFLGENGANIKRLLKRVVDRSTLLYDEINTILVEIEAIVNAMSIRMSRNTKKGNMNR